ncbi:MAG: hypothetical protein QXG01_06825 [Candidatus Bathyarchaeia archaeon]
MENKKMMTVDEEQIIEKTQEAIDDLIQRSNAKELRRSWSK